MAKGLTKAKLDSLNRLLFEPSIGKKKKTLILYDVDQDSFSLKIQLTPEGQKLLTLADIPNAEMLLPKSKK